MAQESYELKETATKPIEESPAGKKARKSPDKTDAGKAAKTPPERTNTRQTALLAALRDTLLPKLMSGELLVRDAEKLAGIHV